MKSQRRGGYLGGGTIVRVGLALPREKTKKHHENLLRERERLADAKLAFEEHAASKLVMSNSDAGYKAYKKYLAQQERKKRRAENKAQGRSDATGTKRS
jgi:hypothetical protein